MKYKVAELEGALLDAAVAKAEGLEWAIEAYRVNAGYGITIVRDEPVCVVRSNLNIHYEPSTDWAVGGPLVEREALETMCVCKGRWSAMDVDNGSRFGPTLLIAAMRCFVASKFGEEVEL